MEFSQHLTHLCADWCHMELVSPGGTPVFFNLMIIIQFKIDHNKRLLTKVHIAASNIVTSNNCYTLSCSDTYLVILSQKMYCCVLME